MTQQEFKSMVVGKKINDLDIDENDVIKGITLEDGTYVSLRAEFGYDIYATINQDDVNTLKSTPSIFDNLKRSVDSVIETTFGKTNK